jgi:hypothetical protein
VKDFKFICGVECVGASRVDKRCNNPVRSKGARCPKHQQRDVPVFKDGTPDVGLVGLARLLQRKAMEEGTK